VIGHGRYDTAVIGMGIVGASAVYALAQAGARVLALDAGAAGAGTSSNSFAWVNSVQKEPDVYHRLNADGMAAHRRLARELGGEAGYHEGGSLEWAEADGERELRARVERLRGRGYPARWINRADALGMEGGLTIPADVPDVVLYEADGWLDAPRLIGRLLGVASARGAEVRERTPVRSLRRSGNRVEALVTDDGEVLADSVLLCVGPTTQAFLGPLGVTIPIGRVAGLLAVTSRPARALGRVIHAPGIHLRPDPSGGLLLGARDVDPLVTDTTAPGSASEVAAVLLERAARVFAPARDVRLVDCRIGVRPMPADNQTVAGRIPGFTNAWMLATHSGVTLGPLLGHLIAGEITGRAPTATLAPFRPERFGAVEAGISR
jgi:glycine/D-amino acid oxidase-like deaminating enzyme